MFFVVCGHVPNRLAVLGFLLLLGALRLMAADFSLLSSRTVPLLQLPDSSPESPRFTLATAKITSPPESPATQPDPRFSLQSLAGQTIVLNTPDLPKINIANTSEGVELFWEEPETLSGFVLEVSTSLTGGTWNPLSVELTPTGRKHRISKQNLTGVRFFRIRKP